MEYRVCEICMGTMIMIVDPWTGVSYFQCMSCGYSEFDKYE